MRGLADNVQRHFCGSDDTNAYTVRPYQQPTFMEVAQKYLQEPVFTTNLKPNSEGWLNFGYIDHTQYQGQLVTATADNSTASWTIDSLTLSAGKSTFTQQMLFGMTAFPIEPHGCSQLHRFRRWI